MDLTSFQSPATSSPAIDNNSNSRKRQRTACDRCKTRKQRCDDAYPVCSNCEKTNSTCSRPPEWERQGRSYTRALEDQISFLETRLGNLEQQQQYCRSSRPSEEHLVVSENHSENCRAQESFFNEDLSDSIPKVHYNVADVVGMLSLGGGNAEAHSYVGSSSGYALATDLGRMVQATVWNKALWVPATSDGGHEERVYSGDRARRITIQELRSDPAKPPSDVLGRKLINAYLVRIHPRFPFLFRSDIMEAHRCRHIIGSEASTQGDQDPPYFSALPNHEGGFALFVLYMVYAIGALNLRLTEDYRETLPEQFYVSAMQHVASVREASPIHNLEATALLGLYHLRSESRHGLWHLIGLAMRTVTDIGLHREASTRNLSPFEAQIRRRLFWSVYSLESILAGTLGRPISLSHCDIDQPLPISIDDNDRMEDFLDENIHRTRVPGQNSYSWTNLSQFVFLSQLHIFEARIQRAVYRVDKPIDALEPKMQRLMADLEVWRRNLPPALQSGERDRVMLHYHRNVRVLLQPFIGCLNPESELFRKCAHAAGQICQIHKRLHQTAEYGHSFVAVHTVFVSGITLLYALWRGKLSIWSFAISNDLRAASSVLSIMGERAPWIRRFRDTFDSMVEATMTVLDEKNEDQVNSVGNMGEMDATSQPADISFFEEFYVDDGTLNMAKELVSWIQH